MISVSEALKAINKSDFNPVYFLIGSEKYFHDQIIKLLSSKIFSDPSSKSLNRIMLYGTENSLSEVVNASLSYPMLSDYKLVVVKEFSKIKASNSEAFSQYLAKPQKSTILVLTAESAANNKVMNESKKMATVVDCKPLSEYRISNWLNAHVKEKGFNFTAGAINILSEYAGNNLLMIEHELRKVMAFKSNDSVVTEEDVLSVTGMSREYNVFTLQKALSQKKINDSFSIGKNLIDSGENINLIVSILFSHFKKTLIYLSSKGSTTDDAYKVSEFQKREMNATLQKFNQKSLENVLKQLGDIDRKSKSTAETDWAMLETLCYNICRQ